MASRNVSLGILFVWNFLIPITQAQAQSHDTPFTDVRMYLRYEGKILWNESNSNRAIIETLAGDPARAQSTKLKAQGCFASAESSARSQTSNTAPSSPLDVQGERIFASELTKCLKDAYTIDGHVLIDGVYVDVEQCQGPSEGCVEWRAKYLEWIRIRDYILQIRTNFERTVENSRQSFQTVAAVFGTLAGLMIGNHIGASLETLPVSLLGLNLGKGDLSAVATMLTPTFGIAAGTISGFIGHQMASQIAYAINKDTIEGFKKAEQVLVIQEGNILHQIGKQKVVDLSFGFLRTLRAALPMSLTQRYYQSHHPIDPETFWPKFYEACSRESAAQYIGLGQNSDIDNSDANGPAVIDYSIIDYTCHLCDLVYKPLKGYIYALNADGLTYHKNKPSFPGEGVALDLKNFFVSSINAMANGTLMDLDVATKFNDRVDFDQSQIPGKEFVAQIAPTLPLERVSGVRIALKKTDRMGHDLVQERIKASQDGTLVTTAIAYRPQKYSPLSAKDRSHFAVGVLKAYGRWFARRVIDKNSRSDDGTASSLDSNSIYSKTALDFLSQFDSLVETLPGKLPFDLLKGELIKFSTSKRFEKIVQAALSSNQKLNDLESSYAEFRRIDGSTNLRDNQLAIDLARVLQPLNRDLEITALKLQDNLIFGAKSEGDAWWATTTFKKSLFILDKSVVKEFPTLEDFVVGR